jgi:hypothetical protein
MKVILVFFMVFGMLVISFSMCNSLDSNRYSGKEVQEYEYNVVVPEDVVVNGLALGDDKLKIIQRIGKPDLISQEVNEFEDTSFEMYYYMKSSFSIKNNELEGFSIVDSKYVLTKLKISVGDNVEKLKKLFPMSFEEEVNSGSSKKMVRVIIGQTNSYLIFTYEKNKIIQYEKWTWY